VRQPSRDHGDDDHGGDYVCQGQHQLCRPRGRPGGDTGQGADSHERALEIAADMPWVDLEPVELWPILHDAPTDL